jgi:hypothetical protein
MKILNFKDFCALPAGAIFSYYKPAVCTELNRKGDTISWEGEPSDFFEAHLVPQCRNDARPTVDNVESRWGLYQQDQLFAVLEDADIQTIRDMLTLPNSNI